MFYGVPRNRFQDLNKALSILADIYEGRFYTNDMLITLSRNMSFQLDEKFMQIFESTASSDQEESLLWRLHTLCWAAQNALHIEGDFVECGVLKAFCSEVILKYIDFDKVNKQAYLYDTFAGLPEKTSTEEERQKWNYSEDDPDALYQSVCQKFSNMKNVHVVKGIVPDSFKEAVPEKIAFLHIDMNSVQAEILALEHLFDRVTPGGHIIFDDYGWRANIKQMFAERDFLLKRNHHVMELPTGQGLVIKHN